MLLIIIKKLKKQAKTKLVFAHSLWIAPSVCGAGVSAFLSCEAPSRPLAPPLSPPHPPADAPQRTLPAAAGELTEPAGADRQRKTQLKTPS